MLITVNNLRQIEIITPAELLQKRCLKILNLDEIEEIKRAIKLEFPEDKALQQVHIARKILSKEAEKQGLKYIDYIKKLVHEIEAGQQMKDTFLQIL